MLTETKHARQGTVRLPSARVEQLRAIGAKLNLSVADVIGYMVGKEIAAGVIPAAIPGVDVARDGDMVLLGFGAHEPVKFSCLQASNIVHDIRVRTQGSELLQGLRAFNEMSAPDFGFAPVSVLRKGRGITIRVRDQLKSFSPALALELADLIEKTAA